MERKKRPTKKEIEDSKAYAKNIMEGLSYYKRRFKELDNGKKKGEAVSQGLDEETDGRGDES